MKEYKLRDYQQVLGDAVLDSESLKILMQLETGGGKSLLIAHLADNLPGRTLVLTHRIEILIQNAKWLKDLGLVTSKVTYNPLKAKTVIAMVQTINGRLKKNGYDLYGKFDNIIVDEAHIQIYEKVYEPIIEFYKGSPIKLVGVTATPSMLGHRTFKVDDVEFKQKIAMGDKYDVMFVGPSTEQLIEWGYLSPERLVKLVVPDFNRLPAHSNTEYTNKQLNTVYNNKASRDILLKAYRDYCVGKKIIIFNATTQNNLPVVEMFKSISIEARSYDSKNNTASERASTLKWFKNVKDAVLVNTSVYTTGLDVTDIDVVIVNRATVSLTLWRQICGRGARTHEGKKSFLTIDLGQNTDKFGMWSEPVDWQDIFKVQPILKKRKSDIIDVWECDNCHSYNLGNASTCFSCGAEKPKPKQSNKKAKDGVLIEVQATKMIIPNGKFIVDYVTSIKESSNYAFKMLNDMTFKMVVENIDKTRFMINVKKITQKVNAIYTKGYFAIIRSNLVGGRKKLSTQLEKINSKISDYYGKS